MVNPIDYVVTGRVARITFADAANRNALTLAAADAFLRTTRAAAADSAIRVIVITARGNFFSVGGHLGEFAAKADDAREHLLEMTDLVHGGIRHLARAEAPVLVALNGMAAGGALGIVLAADLVVARRSAKLNSGYTRSGLTPDGGATWHLPRRVGYQRAFEIMALNESITAEQALTLGLVTRVVDDERFEAEIEALVAALVAAPAGVLPALKHLLRDSDTRSLAAQLDAEASAIATRAALPDTLDRLNRFLKR